MSDSAVVVRTRISPPLASVRELSRSDQQVRRSLAPLPDPESLSAGALRDALVEMAELDQRRQTAQAEARALNAERERLHAADDAGASAAALAGKSFPTRALVAHDERLSAAVTPASCSPEPSSRPRTGWPSCAQAWARASGAPPLRRSRSQARSTSSPPRSPRIRQNSARLASVVRWAAPPDLPAEYSEAVAGVEQAEARPGSGRRSPRSSSETRWPNAGASRPERIARQSQAADEARRVRGERTGRTAGPRCAAEPVGQASRQARAHPHRWVPGLWQRVRPAGQADHLLHLLRQTASSRRPLPTGASAAASRLEPAATRGLAVQRCRFTLIAPPRGRVLRAAPRRECFSSTTRSTRQSTGAGRTSTPPPRPSRPWTPPSGGNCSAA